MHPSRSALVPFGLAALLAIGTGCSTTPDEPPPAWQTHEVGAASDRVLWKVTLLALQKLHFPLAGGLDPSSMVARTGWRTQLAPFSGAGYRKRAEVVLEPLGPGRWNVSTRVQVQTNEALARPLDPRYAEWEWAGEDAGEARVLLQHVRSLLGPEIELRERPRDPIDALLEASGDS